ncbi:MAG: NADH-quinone oxidoreductase subunit L [Pseudomonadota bacterium]
MENIYLTIALAPLLGSLIAGFLGQKIGRSLTHWVTNVLVAVSALLSLYVFKAHAVDGAPIFNGAVYTWATINSLTLEVGFLVDNLTAMMMVVVTSVSLMVHIYTIGYMKEDPGYQRFFCYISLFTFSMLMLVMSNNFLQLFFGWEAVGLVSYLLIGFWYKKPTAVFANLKAFLVNRVGDFGFLLGIGGVLYYFGSLDYATVFGRVEAFANLSPTIEIFDGAAWSVMTVICICLFIGAMGKSAQVPLHVWLPDSMEGPTPISALIHAATMVTAGIFMVTRMSPLFEFSETALSFILFIGAITALFMGFLGIIQNDIKRVVAYSTLSQLGYMVVALGVSAYAAGVFHLMTHAFFKALLFLGAGSVIMGMHHKQDMREMGNIKKYMPWTWVTSLIGTLALIGFPFFSGYYSKEAIILSVKASNIPGADFALICVLAGVFVTALYSFRMYFLVFHTNERMDEETKSHLHESPAVVWVPLVILAIPSIIVGAVFVEPMLFGNFFDNIITVKPEHNVLFAVGESFHGWLSFGKHGFHYTSPFWLAVLGAATAFILYVKKPELGKAIGAKLSPITPILENKYYFDAINQKLFAGGAVKLGRKFWTAGDQATIDGVLVNGSANSVNALSRHLRKLQSGYLYHYAFAMIIGLLAFLAWLMLQA